MPYSLGLAGPFAPSPEPFHHRMNLCQPLVRLQRKQADHLPFETGIDGVLSCRTARCPAVGLGPGIGRSGCRPGLDHTLNGAGQRIQVFQQRRELIRDGWPLFRPPIRREPGSERDPCDVRRLDRFYNGDERRRAQIDFPFLPSTVGLDRHDRPQRKSYVGADDPSDFSGRESNSAFPMGMLTIVQLMLLQFHEGMPTVRQPAAHARPHEGKIGDDTDAASPGHRTHPPHR